MQSLSHFIFSFAVCVREAALVSDPPHSERKALTARVTLAFGYAKVEESRNRGRPAHN